MESQLLPNLIVAGGTKCATTSLFTYLSLHPDICASTMKDSNFFLPIVYGRKLPPIEKYNTYFKHCNRHKYVMETSARYLYGGRKLAQAVFESLGMIKVVLIFRDPIDRLFSYYKHNKSGMVLPPNMSFEQFVQHALRDYKNVRYNGNDYDITVYGENVILIGIAEGFYSDYLQNWYPIFGDSIKVCFFDHLKENPALFMRELCEWFDIDENIYLTTTFSIENKSIKYRNKSLHKFAGSINAQFENFLRKHHSVKKMLRNVYFLFNEANKEKKILSENTLKYIEAVYEPYNDRLFRLLSSKGYSNLPKWLCNYK